MVVKLTTTLWAAVAATAGLVGTAVAADTTASPSPSSPPSSASASVSSSTPAPVTSLFLPGVDNAAELVASVVSVKAPATYYRVECAEDADEDACGAATEGISVTMGPGSYALGIGKPVTAKQTCIMNGDTATCTAWKKGTGDDEDKSTVVTMKDITSDAYFAAVTLTAGVAKLEAAATASGGATTGGSGGGAATPTAGGAPSSGPGATGTPSSDPEESAGSPWAAGPPPSAVLTGLVALIGCALAL